MKKRTVLLLTTIFMAGAMSPRCFAQDAAGASKADQQGQVKTIFSFKDEIALTDDQEVKLKALLYDEQSFMDTSNSTLKTLGTQLSGMIDQKADMQAIKSKLEEIANIQVNVSYRNIQDSRESEMILTPDQLAKWRDIQKKFSAQAKT